MKNKPILLVGYYGANNFGDELILKMYLSQNPDKKFYIFSNGDKYTEDNILETFVWEKNSKLKNIIKFFKVLCHIDEIFWVGGTCFSDEDGDGLFKYMLIGRIFLKKVNYVNIGINNLKKPISILKLKILLITANHFSFRDFCSYNIAKNMKLSFDKNNNLCKNISQDLGELYLKNIPRNIIKEDNLLIAWRTLSRYVNNEDYLINELVKTVEIYNAKFSNIFIIATDSIKDAKISENIYRKLCHLPNIKYKRNISISDKIQVINNSNFIITSRLHVAIAGIIFNAKTFVYNYADKISYYNTSIDNKYNVFNCFKDIRSKLNISLNN